jgi:lysophospholipase L1-like esterase
LVEFFFRLAAIFVVLAVFTSVPTGAADMRDLKIVAFGTSLTAKGGWQPPLQAALMDCLQRPVKIETVARSGASSDWAVTMLGSVIEKKPDIVLIEFYANDAALNRFMTVRHSRDNMRTILDRLKAQLPDVRVIVMAMNPISGIRGFIRPFLDSYIEAHRRLAAEKGFDFFDNRPAWMRLTPDELAAGIPDGSHPVPEVAARTIVPGLAAEIASRECINVKSSASEGKHL